MISYYAGWNVFDQLNPTKAIVLKLEHASEPPADLLKYKIASSTHFLGLGWD